MVLRRRAAGLSIAFVNHHDFRSNSGIHIFNLANELTLLGVRCTALVPSDPSSVNVLGQPNFEVLEYRRARRARPTVIHAWTPRQNVRELTESLVSRQRIPYLVHLEDNEDLIAADRTGLPPDQVERLGAPELRALIEAGPLRYRYFLERAAGVTAVIETLFEFKPDGVPGEITRPAYEQHLFKPQPPDPALRRELGLASDEYVVVYSGNAHSLNAEEMRSLYLAVGLLNKRGRKVKLVRLGDDYVDFLGESRSGVEQHVVPVSYRPRADVPRYLALADVLVQPGAPGRFNDYRVPSKLPEFLAMGKPVILPRSNLGRLLKDGENCLLLEAGDHLELASRIEECLDDAGLRERLARSARAFAEATFSWSRSAAVLKRFYERVA